jgi:predicted small integral membrane protein
VLASVESTYTDIMTSVFSSTIAAKAFFATAAVLLVCVQVFTAARIFGHLQGIVRIAPPLVNRIHRWSGRLAFLCTLPVAFHCIFILGFDSTDSRALTHSIAGSFVYGVFAVKIFFVHDRDHPRWTLPLVGGALAAVIVTLWLTSAYWYFTEVRFGL